MKTKNIFSKFLLGGLLVSAGLMVSCEDYLTILPTGSIPDENFWQSESDVNSVRAAAYYQLVSGDNITNRILYWGEHRSDNVSINNMSDVNLDNTMKGSLYPTNDMFMWNNFYTGISYCNKVLENGPRVMDADPTFSEGKWLPIEAEMKALRALYYFYLVRAYRDVPFITSTISTDAEALEARKGQPAEQGTIILEYLIKDLEACKDNAAKNYGNTADNKGRFTKNSIRALLADIYLWQACLLSHASQKLSIDGRRTGYYILDANGQPVTDQGSLDARARVCYQNAIEHCDYVINAMQDDYNLDVQRNPSRYEQYEKDQPYPMIRHMRSSMKTGAVVDDVYDAIWGGNSIEGILELQYSQGDNRANGALISNYFSSKGGNPKVQGNQLLFADCMKNVDIEEGGSRMKGFSKTDFRACENIKFESVTQKTFPIRKNVYNSVSIMNQSDMTEGRGNSSERPDGSQYGNWPVYRLTDVMTIKAECCARSNTNLEEGFKLVNMIFKRNNPALRPEQGHEDVEGSVTCLIADAYTSPRLNADYHSGKNANSLLDLVLLERQREFFAEGKRWFDLVRQAEYEGKSTDVVKDRAGLPKNVQTHLRTLNAMYVPYYNEERKLNPMLFQNAAWDHLTPKESK